MTQVKVRRKNQERKETKIVKGKVLADALVWCGFAYEKNEDGHYIFKRSDSFDGAWDDLHSLRAFYDERVSKKNE